jgi:hypothetical protein
MISACTALRGSGPPGAAAAQPEGLGLRARGAASSLGHGSISIPSLLLAPHVRRLSAAHAEIINRL